VIYWVGNPVVAFGAHRWMPRPRPSEPMGRLLPDPSGQPQSLVFVQMLRAEKIGDRPAAQGWVAEELARRGVKETAVLRDWFPLGEEEVSLHDSKHFGQSGVKLVPTPPGKPLTVNVSGARLDDGRLPPLEPPAPEDWNKPARIELPYWDGEKSVVKCTLSSSIATMDFYLAVRVEVAASAGGAVK
jgi:hypothetical protein